MTTKSKKSLVPAKVNTTVEHKVQLSITQNDLIEMIINDKLESHQKAIEETFDALDKERSGEHQEQMKKLVKIPKAIKKLCEEVGFKLPDVSFNYGNSSYQNFTIADRASWENSCKVWGQSVTLSLIHEVCFSGERNNRHNVQFYINLPVAQVAPEIQKLDKERFDLLESLYKKLEHHQREYRRVKKESANAKSKLVRESLMNSDEGQAIIKMLDGISTKLLPAPKKKDAPKEIQPY